jgi:hypothetical protein
MKTKVMGKPRVELPAGSLHAGEFGVANQMLFEFRVEGALAAEPGEGAFGFLAEGDLRRRGGRCRGPGWCFEFDFDEVGGGHAGGAGFRIEAACEDEFGLVRALKGAEEGQEVVIVHSGLLARHNPRDVAAGQAGDSADVQLLDLGLFGGTGEGDAQVAHVEVEGFMLSVYSHFMGIPIKRN